MGLKEFARTGGSLELTRCVKSMCSFLVCCIYISVKMYIFMIYIYIYLHIIEYIYNIYIHTSVCIHMYL